MENYCDCVINYTCTDTCGELFCHGSTFSKSKFFQALFSHTSPTCKEVVFESGIKSFFNEYQVTFPFESTSLNFCDKLLCKHRIEYDFENFNLENINLEDLLVAATYLQMNGVDKILNFVLSHIFFELNSKKFQVLCSNSKLEQYDWFKIINTVIDSDIDQKTKIALVSRTFCYLPDDHQTLVRKKLGDKFPKNVYYKESCVKIIDESNTEQLIISNGNFTHNGIEYKIYTTRNVFSDSNTELGVWVSPTIIGEKLTYENYELLGQIDKEERKCLVDIYIFTGTRVREQFAYNRNIGIIHTIPTEIKDKWSTPHRARIGSVFESIKSNEMDGINVVITFLNESDIEKYEQRKLSRQLDENL